LITQTVDNVDDCGADDGVDLGGVLTDGDGGVDNGGTEDRAPSSRDSKAEALRIGRDGDPVGGQ